MQRKAMENNNAIKGYFLATLTVAIWSGWMIISRIGLTHGLTPFDMVTIRFMTSGFIMLPVTWMSRHLITKENWKGILLMCIGAGVPYLGVCSLGFQYAPASHGVLTPSSMTVFVAILSYFIFKEKVNRLRLVGYGLVISGVAFKLSTSYTLGGNVFADLFFLCGGFLWAIYTIQNKRYNQLSPVVATAFVTSASAIALIIPYAVYQYYNPHPLPVAVSIKQMLYQGILTGVVSLITFNRAAILIGSARAASFGALVPVFVTLLAIPFVGEHPTGKDIIFVCMMSFGVFLASGALKLHRNNKIVAAP